MKFKAYTGITWSALELTGLIEDEDSRVYFERYKKHLGLHPFHLTNLNAALNEILSSNLNFYDADLKGFLLAYKNPKLLTPFGEIFYDTCFIHVDVEADFYVFRPKIGCTLKGIVNKKRSDHIGILVHKAFNISIPKPNDEKDWPGEFIEMGHEVRCTITLLDFTCKLPFIRGALNPHEYLQGCRLMESSINNKREFSADNIESNVKGSIKSASKKRAKCKRTFFATDSEYSSDEDVPHIKEEYIEEKKPKKKFKQEKSIDYNDVKMEVWKSGKMNKARESKPVLTDVESIDNQCMNTVTTNGEFGEIVKIEKSVDSTSKVRKKSRAYSSQSSIDEDRNDIKSEKCLSQKTSRKTFLLDLVDDTNEIKSEPHWTHSDIERSMDKSIVDSKSKIKKRSLKRKLLDDSDTSASEFTTEKYQISLNSPSKKSTKGSTMSFIKSEEIPVNIKSEQWNNSCNSDVNSVEGSPKKKLKKHSYSVTKEMSENQADRSTGKSSVKKGLAFLNSIIKNESSITDFGNTQDKDPFKTANIINNDSLVTNDACNSNYDTEAGDENNTAKKKRKKQSKMSFIDTSKIKIEPTFKDVIKIEKTHDGYDGKITKNMQSMEDSESMVEFSSFRKVGGYDDSKVDIKGNKKLSKRKESKNSLVTDSTDIDHNDANVEISRKKKKHCKQLNKSLKFTSDSESEFDIKNIRIKSEKVSDS